MGTYFWSNTVRTSNMSHIGFIPKHTMLVLQGTRPQCYHMPSIISAWQAKMATTKRTRCLNWPRWRQALSLAARQKTKNGALACPADCLADNAQSPRSSRLQAAGDACAAGTACTASRLGSGCCSTSCCCCCCCGSSTRPAKGLGACSCFRMRKRGSWPMSSSMGQSRWYAVKPALVYRPPATTESLQRRCRYTSVSPGDGSSTAGADRLQLGIAVGGTVPPWWEPGHSS